MINFDRFNKTKTSCISTNSPRVLFHWNWKLEEMVVRSLHSLRGKCSPSFIVLYTYIFYIVALRIIYKFFLMLRQISKLWSTNVVKKWKLLLWKWWEYRGWSFFSGLPLLWHRLPSASSNSFARCLFFFARSSNARQFCRMVCNRTTGRVPRNFAGTIGSAGCWPESGESFVLSGPVV